ncbi:helix-turn-helix domain-containing protein [Nicoliella lavandulae]|uniref:Helix-turn-helix domain-containing protein n=1 Tax=Nicoliella lavandulae TaxID=3082954 RepID=A0ABU8SLY1_9LACO
MAKYSLENKLKMVSQYLYGIGSTTISKEFGVKGSSTILYWVKNYRKFGIDGLKISRNKQIYTVKDRVNILNWMKMTKSSYPETADHFNVKSPSSIWNWQRNFELYGISGLKDRRDRLNMAKRKAKNNQNPKDSNAEKLKKLEEENLMLKIENDFLKKLNALDDEENHKK